MPGILAEVMLAPSGLVAKGPDGPRIGEQAPVSLPPSAHGEQQCAGGVRVGTQRFSD